MDNFTPKTKKETETPRHIKDSFYYNNPDVCGKESSGNSNKHNNSSLHFDKQKESEIANMKLLNSPGTEPVLFSGFFVQPSQRDYASSSSFLSPSKNSMQKHHQSISSTIQNIKISLPGSEIYQVVKAPLLDLYQSKDVSKVSFSDLVKSVSSKSLNKPVKKSKFFTN